MDNYMIRVLLGDSVYSKPLGQITQADFEKARDTVREMIVFPHGKLQAWGPSLARCYLNWEATGEKDYMRNGNRSRNVQVQLDRFGEDGLEELLELNKFDMALYAFGLARAEMLFTACEER